MVKTVFSLFLVIAVWALGATPAIAQDAQKIPLIGLLSPGSFEGDNQLRRELLRGLEDLGYVDGKNLVIEYRYAEGRGNLLADLAADLVDLRVSVIVAGGPRATGYAKKTTNAIPIVMAGGGDPVSRGFIGSLSLPGANLTGVATSVDGLPSKRMELIKEAFPGISRVTILKAGTSKTRAIKHRNAAKSLGLDAEIVSIRDSEGIEKVFARVIASHPDALVTIRGKLSIRYAQEIADFAIKKRLPSMYLSKRFVNAGGLMSYGVDYPAIWRRAAVFVDKILKGANPATLPVEPPQLELVINLKTARRIGVTIPPEILLEANEVIK